MTESASVTGQQSRRASNPAAVLPWVRTVVRVGLGVVWIVAGAVKVVDPGQSVVAVEAYEVLPRGLAQVVGWGLPYAEVLLGLALIAGLFTRWSAVISGLLQLAFIAGLLQAWARGLTIDCGCFSPGGQVAAGETTYGLDLIRDIGFLLAAAWLVWQPVTRLSLDGVTGGYAPAAGEDTAGNDAAGDDATAEDEVGEHGVGNDEEKV